MNNNTTALILIVLAAGVYFTYTKGELANVYAIRDANAKYEAAIKNADEAANLRDQALASYNSISASDKDRLDKMLPSTVDPVRLVIDLNSIATRHGIILKGITPKVSTATPTAGGGPAHVVAPTDLGAPGTPGAPGGAAPGIVTPQKGTITISFDTSAGYEQFIDFLKDVEADLRITDVSSLKVSPNDTTNQYDYSITLVSYFIQADK